jgi:hypothetical protein
VDGSVFAQPLYVPGVSIKGATHNVLIVATEADSVYAFDADSNTGANAIPLWKASLVDAGHGAGSMEAPLNSSTTIGCADVQPLIGITATPVIDPNSNTIYVEAKSTNGSSYFHRLHAIALATGAEESPGPALITATVTGSGDGSNPMTGKLTFDALHQQARPGLLLLNGAIYIAFASHCDFGPYHGWLFAYDTATLTQKSLLITTPNGGLGGFWMSGSGIAADAAGNIYIASGNGDFDTTNVPARELGDTLMKLGTTNDNLTLLDYFTPFNQLNLDNNDTDLGSGGVLLLPDQPGAHPHILVAAGKEGTIYVVDRDQLTNPSVDLHYCASGCTNDPEIVESTGSGFLANMYGMPAYWNNTLYFMGQNSNLRSLPITNGKPDFTHPTTGVIGFGFPGATPSISSNGTLAGTAILWAVDTSQFGGDGPGPAPAVLHALDATNVLKELWNSSMDTTGNDKAGNAVKFAVPTIANGKVYIGTSTEVDVYGLKTGQLPPAATPTFTPVAGTYNATQNVTLHDTTSGASIFYTTNGTTPTTSSTPYNNVAIPVSSNETINAIAVATGFTQSAVGSAAYVITAPPPPDFSISAAPASQSVAPSGSTTYTVTVGSLNGFGGVVTLSLSGQPAGATPGFSPATVTGSGTSTLTLTTTTAVANGTYPLTITGASGSVTHTAGVSLTVSAAATIQINSAGGAVGSWVADKDFSGGSASTVTATIDTSGVTNPAPAAVYQSVRWGAFTYTIPNLTPGGTYTVRLHFAEVAFSTPGARLFSVAINGSTVLSNFDIFATAGAKNKALVEQFTATADATGKITISYQVGSADQPASCGIEAIPGGSDFSISATPVSQSVVPGGSTAYAVTVRSIGGFSGVVALSVSGQPTVATLSFNPTTISGSGTSTLTVTTATTTVPGTYPLTIKGTNGSTVHTTSVSLAIEPPAATPTFTPVAGTYNATQNVTLHDTTSGASIFYTTNGTTPTTSSTPYNNVAIPVSSNETINAIAVATGFTQSAVGSAAYVITAPPPPDFSISAAPASQSVAPSGSTTYTVTVGSLNGFGGVVTLSLSGQPAGATPGFSPATVTGSGTSTLTLTTTTAVANGTYPLTITGASGSVTHTAGVSLTVSAAATIQINSAGGAVGSWVADKDFSGGSASTVTATIDTSGVTNPAPAAVYQSVRWGAFTYTIPNLTPGGTYTVRLHFAEVAFSTPGARLFSVAINGSTVLSNFDIFATAGAKNKALVEQFTATADATGKITISYQVGSANQPASSGIEIVP